MLLNQFLILSACLFCIGAYGVLARKNFPYSLILMDWQMPDMDGFQFAEAVRGNPRIGNLPIIALSSVVSPEAIERGRRVGLHDYVAKFDRQGLIAALKEQTGVVRAA